MSAENLMERIRKLKGEPGEIEKHLVGGNVSLGLLKKFRRFTDHMRETMWAIRCCKPTDEREAGRAIVRFPLQRPGHSKTHK